MGSWRSGRRSWQKSIELMFEVKGPFSKLTRSHGHPHKVNRKRVMAVSEKTRKKRNTLQKDITAQERNEEIHGFIVLADT